MLSAFWRKVSTKATASALHPFTRKPRILPEDSENFIKEESRSSRRGKIRETGVAPSELLVLLPSSKKLQTVQHALKKYREISQRLPPLNIIPSNAAVTLYRTFGTAGNNVATTSNLLSRSNIDKTTIAKLARWKSVQSSCEKDNSTEERRQECNIEDHQQSAELCQKMTRRSDDDCEAPSVSRQNSNSDLLNHEEYYRSIESDCPVYSEQQPAPYNDRRECELADRISSSTRRTTSKIWAPGKPATRGEIHHKCKPKPCFFSRSKEACASSSRTPRDRRDEKPRKMKRHEVRRGATTFSTRHCSEPEVESSSLAQIETSRGKETSAARMLPKTYPAYPEKDQTKLDDSSPPKYPRWIDRYLSSYSKRKARASTASESSPMISVSPRKGSHKSQPRQDASSLQDIPQDFSSGLRKKSRGKMDDLLVARRLLVEAGRYGKKTSKPDGLKTKDVTDVPQKDVSEISTSFEDKSANPSIPPGPANKAETKIRQFPGLTTSGSIEKPEKELVMSDVSGYRHNNVARFQYRSSESPSCVKETWSSIVNRDRESDDKDARVRQEARISTRGGETEKRTESRPDETVRRAKRWVNVRDGGWPRQRYKVRLKIFRKGNGLGDPGLPRIVELIQPRGKRTRSLPLKAPRASTQKSEHAPQLRSPCPLDCPLEAPDVETKSYPTKMKESKRSVRERRECSPKKHY